MPNFSLPDRLRQIPLFTGAAEAQIDALAHHAVPRHFAPGEALFMEGDPSAGLWILESGRVKAYKLSPDGGEYVLRIFGPGETFNDLAALDGAPNAVSAAAITAVAAWVIPTVNFAAALSADHTLALAVIQGLVGRQRRLTAQVEDLALRSVTARLARFLLAQVADPALVHPSVTRALIAGHLATTSESISRSLRVLESAGAIRFDRHQIVITNPDILRELAQV
ncbi:MAG: Crp/Fnr family transcriptional regulator [Candidatus Promineofilum sp.]|nr:Crp/Fnr family transcriptional regulator [Promineifilum sp.]